MNANPGVGEMAIPSPTPVLKLPQQLPPLRSPGMNLRGIAVTAPSAGPVLVSLVVGSGQLTLNGFRGLTFLMGDGKGDSHMCFYGSVETVNAALESMVYRSQPGFQGQDTLALAVSLPGGRETAEGRATSAQLCIPVQPAEQAQGMDFEGLDSDEICRWFMDIGLTDRQARH